MNSNPIETPAWARALAALAAAAIAAMLSSCAHLNPPEPEPTPEPEPVVQKKPPPEPMKPPPPSKLYEWWGDEYVSHIEVSINEQKARFYTGDKLVGWTTVASGVHKFPTPTGSFAVTEKIKNKKSNLYGKIYNKNGKLVKRGAKMGVHRIPAGGSFRGAPMPYFMRLTNDGIGLHAGPIPRPGNRASHGCIRMPKNFAPIVYNHVDIGTQVTIKGNGPSYGDYLAKQRRSAPRASRASVAKAKPAPAPAPARAPEGATLVGAGTVSAPGESTANPSAETSAATAATQPPSAQTALSAPTTAPSMAVSPAVSTSSDPATAPTPADASTPPVPGMEGTGMGMGAPSVSFTPVAASALSQSPQAPSVSSSPLVSPAPPAPASVPAPTPAPSVPAREVPQAPAPAAPSGMSSAPAQSSGQQTSSPSEAATPPAAPAQSVQTQG